MMAHASTPGMLYLSSGVLIGFGLSGCSFNLIIASFGKLLPDSWRSTAFGAGTAAGSFGQFLFSPLGVSLIDTFGWQATLEIFAGLLLLIIPLAFAIATPRADAPPGGRRAEPGADPDLPAGAGRGIRSPLLHPAGARLLHLRLPARLRHHPSAGLSARPRPLRGDRRLDARPHRAVQHFRCAGVRLARRTLPKRYILSFIYFARAIAVVALITLPASPTVTLIYGAVTGLLWLSTVPPTSGLVALMFGTRWLAMLFGVAFFSHQVGGFLGV